MAHDNDSLPAMADVLPLLRRTATAVAAARVGLGLVALTRPALVARPWVGPPGEEAAGQVLGRALGARDLALGLGALATLTDPSAGPRAAATWFAAGALSDTFDTAVTAAGWSRLPAWTRWIVAASAAGAAVAGAAGAYASLAKASGTASGS